MMGRLLLLLIALLLPSLVCSSSAAQEDYLKEILLGRCYFAPPSNSNYSADHCPAIVGSIMNVLESHLDADIGANDFEFYLNESDFKSPPNKALVVLHFFGSTKSPTTSFPHGYYVTPETTLGGSLLANLIFCGVDQHGNCSIEKSNAYWKFWEAAYAKFASQVQGHVTIIVEPLADLEFLQRTIIAKLQTNAAVSSVTMYTTHKDCHEMLEGMDNVMCKSDITEFYLDAFNITLSTSNNNDCSTTNATTSESATQEDTNNTTTTTTMTTTTTSADLSKDITHDNSNRARRGSIVLFLLLLALIYGVYHYIYADTLLTDNNNKSVSPRTRIIVDAWHHVRERIGTLWQQFLCMNATATPHHNNEDDEESSSSIMTSTEQSSLLGNENQNFIMDEFGCRIPARRAVAQ